MRTFILTVLVIALIVGGIWAFLVLTTPDDAPLMRFPLSAAHRDLLTRVPASADALALIPTAAVLHRRLLENPVTRDAVEEWTATQPVPPPWIIGAADVVAWKDGKTTSYAIRMDMFRAFLVRIWMMGSSGGVDARWDGTVFVFNGNGNAGRALDAATLDEILALTNGLAEGNMFVVQRNRERGAFPPIPRPAVSSVRVSANEIFLVSRAKSEALVNAPPLQARFARGALITATFSEAPRLLGDLQRLTGVDVSRFAANGGTIAIYDIDTGTLLPRPKGALAVPANPETRALMQDATAFAELVGESHDTGKELVLSLDRESASMYIKDTFAPAAWPANRWSVRVDAARMAPILERLSDSRGLQLAAGRLHRAVRDLRRWIAALQKASVIEAADSVSGGVEELRVRIASK
jgi:hypothetical protein